MFVFIYALCDPRTFEVRYVGKSNNPYLRLRWGHLRDKNSTHKVHWIQYLLKIGLKPTIQILEQCEESIWQDRERFCISFHKNVCKCALTNETEGGDGIPMTREVRKKLSNAAKKRRYTEEEKNIRRTLRIGCKMSEESKKKISIAMKKIWATEGNPMKGKKPWNKGKSSWSKGKHLSDEHKKAIGNSNRKH